MKHQFLVTVERKIVERTYIQVMAPSRLDAEEMIVDRTDEELDELNYYPVDKEFEIIQVEPFKWSLLK